MYRNLGITLDKLLTLDLLKGSRVLAGSNGLSNKITKVNVMEVPDIIEWVSAGELLLTTAYSIKDNINILLELIPKLTIKGVSGLGIKVGRYIKELPQEVITLADELSFPIIEVPFNVSHTDVISGILAEVFDEQMNMLLRIESFNNEVMNIMIKGGNLKEIAQMLFDNIGNSLAIYENINDSYEIICGNTNMNADMCQNADSYAGVDVDMLANTDPEVDSITDKETIEKIVYEHIVGKYMDEKERYEDKASCFDKLGGKLVERITIPIIIDNVEYGSIFMWKDKKELTHLDNMLIDSYVHVIALDFIKKISLYNMESNYKLEFFDDLLSDNEKRQKRAIERAKTFHYHKDLKHSVIILLLKDLYNSSNPKTSKISFVQDSISSLLFIINRIAKLNKERIIYVEKSDRILILFESSNSKSQQIIKNNIIGFCEAVAKEADKKFDSEGDSSGNGKGIGNGSGSGSYGNGDRFTIGIGKAYEGPQELWKSYEQARLIVENLSKKSTGKVMHYDNLGLYKILSFDGMQNELVEFCNDTIKPLLDYDKVNNSELIKTLKIYFECDGNMKKLSEKMFVHYNTIIYRLQKIKDITGMNLEDGDNRLNLQIALKAMDIISL